ncbi:phosphonate C-P lyase system protein PhnH [Aestuariirhabdus sp. Z084]|uniref:phosphonate C-P lyase system protein PhnH n=1 Tax=Aestuariirhabdus haliotis TaxID=2918751 RepID=UPI00201B3ADD|nr:phosphonate C-P lyase system protein PhnH [Aestuariirhabdus haliotis]MCL6416006.1 phosphonate C-P lyase system protein PhnH [Aestuariirhabdus haliotis]MCL6419961.1 phosphonate C-P lyase system protein PhnH [Aestuariirhabdus haliotis]
MSDTVLQPGFADPVQGAQQAFRSLLKVMSEPGIIQPLNQSRGLDGLSAASFTACQTLLDATTKLWLCPGLNTELIRTNLGFHIGCPLIEEPDQADFVLSLPGQLPELSQLKVGNAEYPDRGCTVLLQVDELSAETGQGGVNVRLSGPGIASDRTLNIRSLCEASIDYLLEPSHVFPQGLDFILLADQQVSAIVRTTRVEVV